MPGCCCSRVRKDQDEENQGNDAGDGGHGITMRDPDDLNAVALHCYNLRQQRVATLTPLLAPRFVLSLYYTLSVLFIVLGTVLLVRSARIATVPPVRYDITCPVGSTCEQTLEVTEKMTAPFYIYYGLTNFHQNYRSYVSSRSFKQLAGKFPLTFQDVKQCEKVLFTTPTKDNPEGWIYPCGLTAWSRFNDTFVLCKDAGCDNRVQWTDQGIAWETDQRIAFRDGPVPPWTEGENELITSPDFIVWMRLATFKNFVKLYRIVQEDLEPGTYFLQIESNFPVSEFDGTKFITLSETAWFGTPKRTLGVLYLVVGGALFVLATALLLRHLIMPRKLAYNNLELVREYLVSSLEDSNDASKNL